MFRKLIKNKKAQNTAEYAILISLVVAGIIAMQTYAQRALQSRVRDASFYLKNETSVLGGSASTVQYEPYYLTTDYTTSRNEWETKTLEKTGKATQVGGSARVREAGGFQNMSYNRTKTTGW